MRRTKRGSDRDIEEQLRAARPEPTPEVTRAISDRVRPRRGFMGSLARVPLGPIGGLTAVVVVVALALGGGTAALNTAGNALNVRSSKAKVAKVSQAPSIQQYDDDVLVCVAGTSEVELSPGVASFLVGIGIAEFGPCPDDDD
jgi:hypothetical protein